MNRVDQIRENGATSGAGVLADYTYDNLGRRDYVTRGNGATTDYAYDTASRLTDLDHNLDGSTTTNDQSFDFSFTAASQLSGRTTSNDLYAWANPAAARTYARNGLNQYTSTSGTGATSFTYDARGNLTGDGTRTFTYDYENRLRTTTGAVSLTLNYDPLGRLIRTADGTSTTELLYDGDRLIAEYNGTTLLRRYVHGPGVDEPIFRLEIAGADNRRYEIADNQGSIIAENGSSTTRFTYGPYGEPGNWNGARFRYTGQTTLDANLSASTSAQLYHYKARVYDPVLGRFLQTDPVGYEDQLNQYAYISNDSMNAADPTGGICRDQNINSPSCWRSQQYANLHSRFRRRTSFFGAASMTTEALGTADLNIVGWASGLSNTTRGFLNATGAALFERNIAAARTGSFDLGGSRVMNDRAFVRREQGLVQIMLDGLRTVDPAAYQQVVEEVNTTLNLNAFQNATSTALGNDIAYRRILDQVRSTIGHDINFADLNDRIAIGDALTDAVRGDEKVTCTGSRIRRDQC